MSFSQFFLTEVPLKNLFDINEKNSTYYKISQLKNFVEQYDRMSGDNAVHVRTLLSKTMFFLSETASEKTAKPQKPEEIKVTLDSIASEIERMRVYRDTQQDPTIFPILRDCLTYCSRCIQKHIDALDSQDKIRLYYTNHTDNKLRKVLDVMSHSKGIVIPK
jgi:uncharacterized protein YuzB (UPF0349 family)